MVIWQAIGVVRPQACQRHSEDRAANGSAVQIFNYVAVAEDHEKCGLAERRAAKGIVRGVGNIDLHRRLEFTTTLESP